MYQSPIGPVAAVAGAAVLPATGGNTTLMIASIVTIVVGVAIIATSVIRQMAKKANKA